MSADVSVFAFDGNDVRVAELHGEPAVVLSDLARILGYRSASDAGRMLREHHKGYADVRTPGGVQSMVVVTESGMNRLVMRSKASNAEVVQDWLADDVMPSIRRTGSYNVPDITTPEGVLALAQTLTRTAEELVAARNTVAVLEPRAEAWDEIASADGDLSVADASKMLARAGVPTGPQRLFEQLRDLGWTFRGGDGKWRAYASAVSDGYLSERPQSHHHPRTGVLVLDAPQVRVTIRGVERLRVRLGVLRAVEVAS